MENYKLRISVRYDTQEKHIEDFDIDIDDNVDFVRMKQLLVYNPDSYLVFSLEENVS